MKVLGKILDGAAEVEQLAFYAVVGAALSVGVCLAAGMYVTEKAKKVFSKKP